MPRGQFRSGRFRRIFVRTPGGRVTTHYRTSKPQKALCGQCKKPLSGVPRERAAVIRNMSKTAKRPTRPYGGMFCSACTRALLKSKARGAA